MALNKKQILITAGPTWVPIDDVRVISNISSGLTGALLALEALKRGAKVTLIMGPGEINIRDNSIRVIRYRFFDELLNFARKELSKARYDAIIHAAAVSDFKPGNKFSGKMGSGKGITLKLKPLPKIINSIRKLAPDSLLVMFKLESKTGVRELKKRALAALNKTGSDAVVANSLKPYRAFILSRKANPITAMSKKEMAKRLIRFVYSQLQTPNSKLI